MLDPLLLRLLIAVLVFFLFEKIIELLVTKPDAKKLFDTILLIGCVLYVIFGSFLPFK